MKNAFPTLPGSKIVCVMRKWILLLLLGAATAACEKPLFEESSRESQGNGRPARPAPYVDTLEAGVKVYATSVVFPDSVDWRAGNTHDAKLVLWKDSTPFGSLPAGDRPDPLRHRVLGGHLWTDDTDGNQTTVSCDGEPFFSFPGEELFSGFVVADGHVHTLGQHPGGGFSYRVDGEEVFTSATGVPLGRTLDSDWEGGSLMKDGTDVYFAYRLPVEVQDGVFWEYRVMKGGEPLMMLPAIVGGEMLDIRVLDGMVYRLEQRYERLVLFKGQDILPLLVPTQLQAPRLVVSGGHMRVKVNYDGNWLVFDSAGIYDRYSATLPESYRLYTQRCEARREGIFARALTNTSTGEHLLVVDEEQTPVRFNGYFTGIYIR